MKTPKTIGAKAKQIFRISLKKLSLVVMFLLTGFFMTATFIGAIMLLGVAALIQWVRTVYEERFPEPNDYNQDGDY